jgi:hypothetical protein
MHARTSTRDGGGDDLADMVGADNESVCVSLFRWPAFENHQGRNLRNYTGALDAQSPRAPPAQPDPVLKRSSQGLRGARAEIARPFWQVMQGSQHLTGAATENSHARSQRDP